MLIRRCVSTPSVQKTLPRRILVTNDDGPPSNTSPFVVPFVRRLLQLHHEQWAGAEGAGVGVCLPAQQQSWRGKSHDPYRCPVAVTVPDLTAGFPTGLSAVWYVDTTPAGVANIGLSHLFESTDLLISGPNFGENAGRMHALSSGTLGAAMEGAMMGYPAVAISFDIPSEQIVPSEMQSQGATEAALGVIERLWTHWSTAEVYNVNVPLDASRDTPVHETHLDRDSCGSLFEKSIKATTASVPFMITRAMRVELAALGHTQGDIAKMTPQAAHDVLRSKKASQAGPPEPVWYAWSDSTMSQDFKAGSDRWALAQGEVSVTALDASYSEVDDKDHSNSYFLKDAMDQC